jgi:hypothetical protein
MKHPSPKDIEEMRARGYEASTIRKAEEQSKRWHLAQEVAERIRNAFSGVTLGQGVGLRQAQGIDGYEEETAIADYRQSDEKENWSRIPPDALNECQSSLSFFDAEGMRFHLPAYLLADLNVSSWSTSLKKISMSFSVQVSSVPLVSTGRNERERPNKTMQATCADARA